MKRNWMTTGLSGLALLSVAACAGPNQWERNRDAATAAYIAGSYTVSE